jgi:hypothetical protein
VMVSACPAASNAARTRSTDPPASDPDMPALVARPRRYAKRRGDSPSSAIVDGLGIGDMTPPPPS